MRKADGIRSSTVQKLRLNNLSTWVGTLVELSGQRDVDAAPDIAYNEENIIGGNAYAVGLQQDDRGRSSGDSAQGLAGVQSVNRSGTKRGRQHGQVAVDTGILRVSNLLRTFINDAGTVGVSEKYQHISFWAAISDSFLPRCQPLTYTSFCGIIY